MKDNHGEHSEVAESRGLNDFFCVSMRTILTLVKESAESEREAKAIRPLRRTSHNTTYPASIRGASEPMKS